MSTTLIVFSHLRWNFVFQRPQHLMSRFAGHYRVLFVEEPIADPGPAFLEVSDPMPNVRVMRPHTPIAADGFHPDQLPVVRDLLAAHIAQERLDDHVAWFYTPMALPLLAALRPRAIVYDCMDELSAFRNPPAGILERERELLAVATLVFTGGPSLYRAKRDRHRAVYCFPSSVERGHFARGRDRAQEHPDQRELPSPRLGYYGVIDERMDLPLIDQLAAAHPEWQVVMVGPVLKIDAGDLPRRKNLRYFGQQAYDDLPRFLAGWDVALLPFAINDATRFISPTKTLEYMAAEKPIVSTPITDVVEPYGHIVHIGGDAGQFIGACEAALRATPAERERRAALMRRAVQATSWDVTATRMYELIQDALGEPPRDMARASVGLGLTPHSNGNATPRHEPATAHERRAPKRYPVAIVGAGPTGLSAAYHAGRDSVLIEQHDRVGGWCRSLEDNGFTFDYAGHIMFSKDPYVHELYQMLLGDNVHWQDREAWIYSKGVYTRYPFQGALYGLPPDVLKECLVGAIEARFGSLTGDRPAGGAPGRAANADAASRPAGGGLGHQRATAGGVERTGVAGSSPSACKAESITDCCADGIAESEVPVGGWPASPGESGEPRNFEEFIYRVWGKGVAKHFAIPYNRKLWAVPLHEMETSWLGGRVPLPDLEEMIEGALRPVAKPMGPNARFGYPLRGGFQAMMDAFVPHLTGELRLGTRVTKVIPSERRLVLDDGTALRYEQLVSTMPLPTLVSMMGYEAPERVRQAAQRLRNVSVRCVNIGVGRERLTEKHWIYYPEETVFHRIFVQGNASPHCNPPGGFGLTCEITYSPHKPLPCDGEALIDRCIADCIAVGLIREDDPILARNQVDMPYAYVVYDHDRKASVETIRDWCGRHDILLAGRYSEWEYYNSDHAFVAGRDVARAAMDAIDARRGLAAPARPRLTREAGPTARA